MDPCQRAPRKEIAFTHETQGGMGRLSCLSLFCVAYIDDQGREQADPAYPVLTAFIHLCTADTIASLHAAGGEPAAECGRILDVVVSKVFY